MTNKQPDIEEQILAVGSFTTDDKQAEDIAKLKDLIAQQVQQARIDELKHIEGGEGLYWWGDDKRDIAMTVEERIKELEQNK